MTGRRPKRRRPASDSDEIERLRRENERLREKVDEQAKQIADAEKQIADAEKQIADLERQLALRQQNSTTTSKPPSSDGLAGQQRVRGRRKKSRRKPGGQPGHPGHSRPLVPIERVNAMVELFPDACRHCQHALPARSRQVVGEPRRHQVTELPPIEAHITEYRCHRIVCPACGQTTQAPLPTDVAGQFGPQLTALIAYLTVVCRLPRLVVQRLLEGALQISISQGSTQHAWEEASAAVAAPCQELERALPQQSVLNGDETGHRTNGDKRCSGRWSRRRLSSTHRYVPRRGRPAAPARGHVCWGLGQRSLADLPDVRRRRTAILLGAFHTQLAERAGTREDRLGETLLSRGTRPAATTLPLVASLSRGPARPRRTAHPRGIDREGVPDREEVLRAW